MFALLMGVIAFVCWVIRVGYNGADYRSRRRNAEAKGRDWYTDAHGAFRDLETNEPFSYGWRNVNGKSVYVKYNTLNGRVMGYPVDERLAAESDKAKEKALKFGKIMYMERSADWFGRKWLDNKVSVYDRIDHRNELMQDIRYQLEGARFRNLENGRLYVKRYLPGTQELWGMWEEVCYVDVETGQYVIDPDQYYAPKEREIVLDLINKVNETHANDRHWWRVGGAFGCPVHRIYDKDRYKARHINSHWDNDEFPLKEIYEKSRDFSLTDSEEEYIYKQILTEMRKENANDFSGSN